MAKFLSDISLEQANDLQFKTAAGANAGKIEQDGNNLVLSNAVGDVLLGDGASDVYIGDGTNNVDILFEQSGSIKGDGSAITLTLGGANTTLNLENPNINGTFSIGATTISDKLTFTTTNGYILFDYEPSGDTGEYTTEVPLLKVGMGTAETAVLSRISEYRGVVLGADDTVWLRAGDTGSVIKTNVGLTTEVVLMSAEQGFHAYAFPNNDTTWSNRNEFRFYGGNSTAADNGLYIGDGGNTQFIDLSRNITAASITSSGHIKARSGGNLYVYDDDDDTKIHFSASSNATEGVLAVHNGSNYGLIARGITNSPRLGAYHNGHLDIYGFGSSSGADHANDDQLARFDFANERFDVNGEIRGDGLDIDGNATFAGTVTGTTFIGALTGTASNAALLDSIDSNQFAYYNSLTFADSQEKTNRSSVFPAPGRSTTVYPASYQRTLNLEFKSKGTMNNPGTGNSWLGIMSMAPYATGGSFYTNQIAMGADGTNSDLFIRRGNGTGNGTWGDWRQIITSDSATFTSNLTVGGNSLTAGSLDINGDADISGDLTVTNNININRSVDGSLVFQSSGASKFFVGYDSSPEGFRVYNQIANETALFINGADSNATFAGDVIVGDDLNISGNELTFTNDAASAYIRGADALFIESDHDNDDGGSKPIYFYTNGAEMAKMEATAATFAGTIGSGAITSTGTVTADTYFESSDISAVLASQNNGSVFLRPNGVGSGTGAFSVSAAGKATVSGELEATSLDINGAADISGTLTVGADDTGYDVKFYGATSGRYLHWDESEDALRFQDGVIAKFGTGKDLQISHDGSNSYINANGTGDLIIKQMTDDKSIIFQNDDGSGGVETYFQLEGASGGGDPFTVFPDNSTLSFGSGHDYRFRHDGSHSYIQNYVGNLNIYNYTDDGNISFHCDDGSGGVTPYLTLDGGDEKVIINKGAQFETSLKILDNVVTYIGTGNDLRIHHNGSNSYISQEGTGSLYIRNTKDDQDIIFQSDDGSGGTTAYLTLDGGLGYTTVHKQMKFDDSTKITLGTSGDFQFWHSGSASYIHNETGNIEFQNNADDADIVFKTDDGSGGTATYLALDGGISSILVYRDILMANDGNDGNIKLGASQDLVLNHDGTSSIIQNATGDLKIINYADDKDIRFFSDDGSGGVAEYLTIDGSAGTVEVAKEMNLAVPLATDQQKHLAWFEIAGFGTGDGTNYEISVNLDNDTAPFSHNVSTGANGTTAITVQNIMRSGGTVIPQAGTIKRWKGWATTAGSSTANVALFKITPTRNDNADVAPVLIDNVSYTAVGNAKMMDFEETSFTDASVAAGDIVVTGIKCEENKTTYFGSTLEIEF